MGFTPLEPSSPSPLKRITSQIILNFAALSNNLSIDGVKPYSFALASSERSKILFSVNLVFF